MPTFEYIALNTNGQKKKGVIENDSEKQVSQILKQQQLAPIDIKILHKQSAKNSSTLFSGRSFGHRMSHSQLVLLTRQLATMLRSGSPVESALSAVIQQTRKNQVKTILTAMRTRVREGFSLAQAMDDFPQVFSELYRATVAAGEEAGRLDYILDRLATHEEQTQAIKRKISLALIYPAVLTTVALIVIIVLLSYVVPKVVQVFQDIDQVLPPITLLLIAISDFFKAYGLYLSLIIFISFVIFQLLLNIHSIRFTWHRFLMKLPGISYFIQGMNTALFTRTFSILTGSGVNVLEAMRIASSVIRNLRMKQAVLEASESVREGKSIHWSLEQTQCFPPMTTYLIASGESSGQLVEMLDYAAESQEKEYESIISTLMSLFEPALIITMGAIVLFIVIAILLPIFQLNQLVGV